MSQISQRTWADRDEQAPRSVEIEFVQIYLVGHEDRDSRGEPAQSLTVTDVFTSCTQTQAVRSKAWKWVFAALVDLRSAFPFPMLGVHPRAPRPAQLAVVSAGGLPKAV